MVNLSLQFRRQPAWRQWAPAVGVALAAMLSLSNWPWLLLPVYFLVLFYWALHRPDRLGRPAIMAIALVLECWQTLPFGFVLLVSWLLYEAGVLLRRWLLGKPFWQLWAMVAGLLIIIAKILLIFMPQTNMMALATSWLWVWLFFPLLVAAQAPFAREV